MVSKCFTPKPYSEFRLLKLAWRITSIKIKTYILFFREITPAVFKVLSQATDETAHFFTSKLLPIQIGNNYVFHKIFPKLFRKLLWLERTSDWNVLLLDIRCLIIIGPGKIPIFLEMLLSLTTIGFYSCLGLKWKIRVNTNVELTMTKYQLQVRETCLKKIVPVNFKKLLVWARKFEKV